MQGERALFPWPERKEVRIGGAGRSVRAARAELGSGVRIEGHSQKRHCSGARPIGGGDAGLGRGAVQRRGKGASIPAIDSAELSSATSWSAQRAA